MSEAPKLGWAGRSQRTTSRNKSLFVATNNSGGRLCIQPRLIRRRIFQHRKGVLVLDSQKLTNVATGGDMIISNRLSCLLYGEELGRG